MARTVHTGPQTGGQNPFGPAAEAGGRLLANFLASRIRDKKREEQARQLAQMFGPTPGGGQQGQQQPPQVQPTQPSEGRNPFSVPAMQGGQTMERSTGQQPQRNDIVPPAMQGRMMPAAGPTAQRVLQQQLERRGIAPQQGTNMQSRQESRPSPAGGGSPQSAPAGGQQRTQQGGQQPTQQRMGGQQAPQIGQNRTGQSGQQQGAQLTAAGQRPQMDPEVERTARAMTGQRSGLGGMLARMPMDQRVQFIQRMQEQGVRTDQIMEMAAPEQREPETVTRVVSGDNRLNRMFNLGIPEGENARVTFERDPQTGGLVNPSVEGRFATGGDQGPLSTDQLEAQTIQKINSGELTPEEGQRRLELIRGSGGGNEWQTLSTEEATQLGYPEGSIVQRNSDGKLAVRHEPDSGSVDQREREIRDFQQDLMRNTDLSEQEAREKAIRYVDGRARVEVSEDGSSAMLVDEVALASGEENAVQRIQLRQPDQPERPEFDPQQTLFEQADEATGPSGTVLSTTARIPGREPSESERRAIEARRAFELTENEIARGLVINDKFPVRERQAVIDAVNISPSFFDTEEAMRARLVAADRFLRSRLQQAERDASDESLPEDTREAQRANASAIRNAVDRLGVPEAGGDISRITPDSLLEMGSAQSRFVIDNMTTDEAKSFIRNNDAQSLDRLPDSLTDRLKEKVQNG